MWVPGNILYIIFASIIFIRWMQAQDEKQRAEEASMYEEEDAQQEGIDTTEHVS